MSGTEVAALLGTSPRAAIARLAGAGIKPSLGPPACRQTVFYRSEVEAFIDKKNRPQAV